MNTYHYTDICDERSKEFFAAINDIDHLDDKRHEPMVKTIFIRALNYFYYYHDREMRDCAVQLLATAVNDPDNQSLTHFFICLDRLTANHLKVLFLIIDPKSYLAKKNKILLGKNYNSLSQVLNIVHPDISHVNVLLYEMRQMNLITAYFGTESNVENYHGAFTDFGKDFISAITKKNNSWHSYKPEHLD